MSIQSDILETIGSGGIEISALQKAVGNVGANELDVAVNALLRAKRLRVIANRYEVIPSTRRVGQMPVGGNHRWPEKTDAPPSAEEEAAQSLRPAEPVRFHSARKQSVNGGSGVMPTDAPLSGAAVQPDGSEPSPTSSASSFEGAKINTVLNGSGDATPSAHGAMHAGPVAPAAAASSCVLERAQAKRQEVLNRLALARVDLANLEMALDECDRFLELYQRFAQEAV